MLRIEKRNGPTSPGFSISKRTLGGTFLSFRLTIFTCEFDIGYDSSQIQ